MKALIGLFLVSVALPQLTADENSWLQWRGPNRDGMVAGAEWPDKLGEDNLLTRAHAMSEEVSVFARTENGPSAVGRK